MNRIRNNRRGETLVETLVALLIASISMAMLAGMVNSSVRITQMSVKDFEQYYEDSSMLAEKDESEETAGTGTVQLTGSGTSGSQYYLGDAGAEVTYFTNGNAKRTKVYSYVLSAGGAGGEPEVP